MGAHSDPQTNVNVTRDQIRSVIDQWAAGSMTGAQVHDWAVARYATSQWDPEDDVANAVLAWLDKLDVDLIVSDDAPAFLRALDSSVGSEVDAESILDAHYNTIDLATRRGALRSDPLYRRFR